MWQIRDTINLGEKVLQKRRYYLDTKYWIYLRDVERGGGSSVQKRIYQILHSIIQTDKAICPISYHSFIELQKQSDNQTLLATARLMDKLSNKICFIPLNGIFQQELICYLRSRQLTRRGIPVVSAAKYVWTKIPYLFGNRELEFPDASQEEAELVKKEFYSFWKNLGLFDMLSRATNMEPHYQDSRIVEFLNEGKDQNQNWTTFDQICIREIEGGLSILEEEINEVLIEFSKSCENGDPRSYAELLQVVISEWKENGIVAGLPFISIRCLMHSFFRYNKTQRFKPNDLSDFGHATWAIPYCNAFFTERSLANMVTNNLLKLDQKYDTKIMWKEEQVLEYLKRELEVCAK